MRKLGHSKVTCLVSGRARFTNPGSLAPGPGPSAATLCCCHLLPQLLKERGSSTRTVRTRSPKQGADDTHNMLPFTYTDLPSKITTTTFLCEHLCAHTHRRAHNLLIVVSSGKGSGGGGSVERNFLLFNTHFIDT